MVHGVAHQSGGRLILKSEKGCGTTAELWLPCSLAPVAEPTVTAETAVPASVRPLAVLLVDDDILVLHSAAAMLEDLGHSVFSANSGEQALRLLEQHPEVDVLITDQAMPRMTGADLAAAAQSMRPQLPIVLASGYAELSGGSDSGLTRLAKPFTQRELSDAIRQAIKVCVQ
jgi:CheY-like chemotaxis protein